MSADAVLLTTPLNALHREFGARMVPFAGYDMPVQFPAGVMAEHKHTRNAAGLFDVSHMGQIRLDGPDAAAALECLVPVDVVGLKPGQQRYAFFTNEQGGILDDLMIVRPHADDGFGGLLLVVNAACKDADLAHLQKHIGTRCTITPLPERALLADARVQPIGLGARDTLRLEAGLCLYGHDIDTTTSPIEAGLQWAIQKVRRPDGERAGGYPGADRIGREFSEGTARKRVGLVGQERAPVREGATLHDANGTVIGRVTSGTLGPTVNQPVAMGWLQAAQAAAGTVVHADVRGKRLPMTVTPMPFAPHRYAR